MLTVDREIFGVKIFSSFALATKFKNTKINLQQNSGQQFFGASATDENQMRQKFKRTKNGSRENFLIYGTSFICATDFTLFRVSSHSLQSQMVEVSVYYCYCMPTCTSLYIVLIFSLGRIISIPHYRVLEFVVKCKQSQQYIVLV